MSSISVAFICLKGTGLPGRGAQHRSNDPQDSRKPQRCIRARCCQTSRLTLLGLRTPAARGIAAAGRAQMTCQQHMATLYTIIISSSSRSSCRLPCCLSPHLAGKQQPPATMLLLFLFPRRGDEAAARRKTVGHDAQA